MFRVIPNPAVAGLVSTIFHVSTLRIKIQMYSLLLQGHAIGPPSVTLVPLDAFVLTFKLWLKNSEGAYLWRRTSRATTCSGL